MADDRKLDFVKVLIAAAWADGEITCEEMNNLKAYFRELELTNDELTLLEPYLADPIAESEASTILDDFLSRARGKERATVLAAVRDLLVSDGVLEEGEEEFLDRLENAREEMTTAGVFVAQLKRLWGAKGSSDERFRRSDLVDEFIRNRVLYQVKRRLHVAGGSAELDEGTERELRYVCTLAALLGHVAGADQTFDDDERAAIGEILDEVSALQPRDLDIIVEIAESEVLSDVGYGTFTRELKRLATMEERRRVLRLLFDVAAADGEISADEVEQIRRISNAVDVSPSDFHAIRSATLPPGG